MVIMFKASWKVSKVRLNSGFFIFIIKTVDVCRVTVYYIVVEREIAKNKKEKEVFKMKETLISSRKVAQVVANKMVNKCLETAYSKDKITLRDFANTASEIKSYSEIMGALTCKDDLLLLGKFANELNDLLGSYLDSKLSREDFVSHLSDASDNLHQAIFEIEGK